MRHICAFNDMSKFSFIEYLMWTYQKTVCDRLHVLRLDKCSTVTLLLGLTHITRVRCDYYVPLFVSRPFAP